MLDRRVSRSAKAHKIKGVCCGVMNTTSKTQAGPSYIGIDCAIKSAYHHSQASFIIGNNTLDPSLGEPAARRLQIPFHAFFHERVRQICVI